MLTYCVEKVAKVAMRTVSTSTFPNTCQTTINKTQAPRRIDVFLGSVQFLSLFQSNVLMKQSPVCRLRPDTLSLTVIVFQLQLIRSDTSCRFHSTLKELWLIRLDARTFLLRPCCHFPTPARLIDSTSSTRSIDSRTFLLRPCCLCRHLLD